MSFILVDKPGSGAPLHHCIFAVPLDPDDELYHYCPKQPLFHRQFASPSRRKRFWDEVIVPETADQPGPAYKIVMLDLWRHARFWQHVGEPRYSDSPIVSRRPPRESGGIVDCTTSSDAARLKSGHA